MKPFILSSPNNVKSTSLLRKEDTGEVSRLKIKRNEVTTHRVSELKLRGNLKQKEFSIAISSWAIHIV